MKTRILALLLAAMMLIPLLASCGTKTPDADASSDVTTEGEELPSTEAPSTEAPTTGTEEPPKEPVLDPNASVYSGTPDPSWYTGDKTEYVLTSADQLVGFHSLRSATFDYEGITIKLDCDVILNPGTAEEIKARGAQNHAWKQLNSAYLFKGTFDGQGHTVSGLYMQLGTSAVRGMFGGVGGNATIKNLNLINSYFGGPGAANKTTLGSIAAKISGTSANVTLENIWSDAILEEGTQQFSRVGGLVGQAAEGVTLNMNNCVFNGSISITGEYAGGMIGYASHSELVLNMTNCINYGKITASAYVGGMTGTLGAFSASQTDCKNKGMLVAKHTVGELNGRSSLLNDPTNGARPTNIPEGTTALRVMSFNVQGTLPKTGGILTDAAKNRMEAVRQEILFYEPDLLGLQEDNATWNTLINLEGYNMIWDPMVAAESAILYKKGLKLIDSDAFWLTADGTNGTTGLTYKELSDPNSKYYMTPAELEMLDIKSDADLLAKKKTYVDQKTGEKKTYSGSYVIMTVRRATYGVFDINGQTVIYVNTHLTHRSPNAVYSNDAFQKARSMERLKEFDLIHARIDELKKTYPDARIIMTGDWNDHPYTPIYNSIVDDYGYICANFNSELKYGVDGSWNNACDMDKQGDNYPDPDEGTGGSYLDYCFFDKEVTALKFRSGAGKATITAVDGSQKTIYTSDHLPIITDLCFKTPKTGSPIDPNYKEPETPAKDPTIYSGVPDISWYTGKETEYVLTSADQLMGFQALRVQQISFEGVTIKLDCDVIINQGTLEEIVARGGKNHAWAQLNSAYLFKGTFDGQGHTISGVYMQLGTSAVRGMFGGVSGNAVIKNFTLENCYFGGPSANKDYLGCLIAKVSGGADVTVSDVTIRNVLMQEKAGTLNSIGGFVGVVESGNKLTVTNCSFEGTIDFGTKGNGVGGFIGLAAAGSTVNLNGCSSLAVINAASGSDAFVGSKNASATVTLTACTTK